MKKNYLFYGLIIFILLAFIMTLWWQNISQYFNCVEENISLEGIDVGKSTQEELTRIVAEMAKAYEYESINAEYNDKYNTIIPELCGCVINQEKTIENVLNAKDGAKLSLVREYIAPEITIADYPYAVIRKGNMQKKAITLMINIDWGVPEPILSMIEVLKSYNVKTTFCITGRILNNYPEVIKEIVFNGHEIASHGYHHHSSKYNYYEMTKEQFIKELKDTEAALTRNISSQMMYFSPPSGIVVGELLQATTECGYRTVLWTEGLDTIDWQEPPPSKIFERVRDGVINGGIVLMHPKKQTLEALPNILDWLSEEGYRVVPLRELLSPYLIASEVK